MKRRPSLYTRAALIGAFVSLALLPRSVLGDDQGQWIGTWASSPTGLPAVTKMGPFTIPSATIIKGTIRFRVRVSQGGSQIRLRLSNEYGDEPLNIAAASVGLAGEGLNAAPRTLKPVLFAKNRSIVIPAGAPVLTDSIDLKVKALSDLVVSVYVPDGVSRVIWPFEESATYSYSIVVDDVDATLMEHLPEGKMLAIRPIVSAVNVLTDRRRRVIAALGDSLTDGRVDAKGERGWPGVLSRRLTEAGASVVNAGIGGNRLLQSVPFLGASALSRLDRDVFSVPGLSHIVLLEGINDIGMSGKGAWLGDSRLITPEYLIVAYSQIIARAHERGVKVIGATIPPFEGAQYFDEEKERVREAANEWIRTSKAFDGVIDFDVALRDPTRPRKLKRQYDTGDHLHPNLAGYRAMGEVIDLNMFN